MKEAIERVIAELSNEHKRLWHKEQNSRGPKDEFYYSGSQDALTFAITKLREVIASDDIHTSNRQTSPGGTDDTTK